MINMEDLAQLHTVQDVMNKVDREREAFARGEDSEYAQGGGMSVVPSANGGVPVSFQEPGLEDPLINPADIVAGGLVGAVAKGGSNRIAGKIAREFSDGVANFPRHTKLGQDAGGKMGQAIVDGNPYLRTELGGGLSRLNSAKPGYGGGWTANSYPYTRDGSYLDRDRGLRFGADTYMKIFNSEEMSPELQTRLLDDLFERMNKQ